MQLEERNEAVEIIRKYIRGEIEEEPLLGFVRRLELHSFHQLSSTLELGSEDFRRIGFGAQDLARLIEECLAGRMSLVSLRHRVQRIAQIFSTPEYRSRNLHRRQLAEALSLLVLVLDAQAPIPAECMRGYLVVVCAALARRRPAPFAAVVGHIVRRLEACHFLPLAPLDLPWFADEERLPWTDLALLYGPREPAEGARPRGEDRPEADLTQAWFIPLSVTTRQFYLKGLPARLGVEDRDEGWMHPENCKIPCLRERHPWLAADRFRPSYLVDRRGFAEIVLDVPALTRPALEFAIRAFALQNGVEAATLSGQPVALYPAGC